MTKAQKNAWIVEHIRILYEDEIRLERYHERKGISNHCARESAFLKLQKFLIASGVIPMPSEVSDLPSGPYPDPPIEKLVKKPRRQAKSL